MKNGKNEDEESRLLLQQENINNASSQPQLLSLTSSSSSPPPPSMTVALSAAALYILSGVTQPLLMTIAKYAGIADPKCQLYMLFYYIGPAAVTFTLLKPSNRDNPPPSKSAILKSGCIAIIDIFAQALNYTGSTLAGPTIFAIIYSSVTVWTALYSRLVLKRFMNIYQWMGVSIVFGGLVITVFSSVSYGTQVIHGSILVFVGSSCHALTYVLSEVIMTVGVSGSSTSSLMAERLSVRMNCAVQGIVAFVAYVIWQMLYTSRHYTEAIQQPMSEANTTVTKALLILGAIAISNLVHALTFFHTLKHFPGGATSAGVMKGLQAVLVFVVTSWVYCGRLGGEEMCFSELKFVSLIVVVGGVILYGYATSTPGSGSNSNKGGDDRIIAQDK